MPSGNCAHGPNPDSTHPSSHQSPRDRSKKFSEADEALLVSCWRKFASSYNQFSGLEYGSLVAEELNARLNADGTRAPFTARQVLSKICNLRYQYSQTLYRSISGQIASGQETVEFVHFEAVQDILFESRRARKEAAAAAAAEAAAKEQMRRENQFRPVFNPTNLPLRRQPPFLAFPRVPPLPTPTPPIPPSFNGHGQIPLPAPRPNGSLEQCKAVPLAPRLWLQSSPMQTTPPQGVNGMYNRMPNVPMQQERPSTNPAPMGPPLHPPHIVMSAPVLQPPVRPLMKPPEPINPPINPPINMRQSGRPVVKPQKAMRTTTKPQRISELLSDPKVAVKSSPKVTPLPSVKLSPKPVISKDQKQIPKSTARRPPLQLQKRVSKHSATKVFDKTPKQSAALNQKQDPDRGPSPEGNNAKAKQFARPISISRKRQRSSLEVDSYRQPAMRARRFPAFQPRRSARAGEFPADVGQKEGVVGGATGAGDRNGVVLQRKPLSQVEDLERQHSDTGKPEMRAEAGRISPNLDPPISKNKPPDVQSGPPQGTSTESTRKVAALEQVQPATLKQNEPAASERNARTACDRKESVTSKQSSSVDSKRNARVPPAQNQSPISRQAASLGVGNTAASSSKQNVAVGPKQKQSAAGHEKVTPAKQNSSKRSGIEGTRSTVSSDKKSHSQSERTNPSAKSPSKQRKEGMSLVAHVVPVRTRAQKAIVGDESSLELPLHEEKDVSSSGRASHRSEQQQKTVQSPSKRARTQQEKTPRKSPARKQEVMLASPVRSEGVQTRMQRGLMAEPLTTSKRITRSMTNAAKSIREAERRVSKPGTKRRRSSGSNGKLGDGSDGDGNGGRDSDDDILPFIDLDWLTYKPGLPIDEEAGGDNDGSDDSDMDSLNDEGADEKEEEDKGNDEEEKDKSSPQRSSKSSKEKKGEKRNSGASSSPVEMKCQEIASIRKEQAAQGQARRVLDLRDSAAAFGRLGMKEQVKWCEKNVARMLDK